MRKSDTSWSPLYVGIAIFGAFGGSMWAKVDPTSAVPTLFIVLASCVAIAFGAWTVFAGLWRRFEKSTDRSVLEVSIWDSPPSNPQSNRLAQVIFFGSIGISSLVQARSSAGLGVSFLPLAVAVGVAVGLLAFRWEYRRRLSRGRIVEKI